MISTIDRAGRLVVPRELRQRLGLVGGEQLELTERDGVITIAVAPTEVEIVTAAKGVIARAKIDLPPLTDSDVQRTLDAIRR